MKSQIKLLTDAEKKTIKSVFNAACKEIVPEDEVYVRSKISRTVKRLERSDNPSLQDLAKNSKLLFKLYEKLEESPRLLNDAQMRTVIAALFYLCNPFDVIPDFDPSRGYADDSFVINSVIKELNRSKKGLLDSIENNTFRL